MATRSCLIPLLLFAFMKGSLAIFCVTCSGSSSSECAAPRMNGGLTVTDCGSGTDQCYVQVTALGGQLPFLRRGCGAITCGGSLPDPSTWVQYCDNDRVTLPFATNSPNASFVFNGKNQVTNVLYCKNAEPNGCNRGGVQLMPLPGFYNIVVAGSSSISATLLTIFLLPILAKILA